MNRRQLVEAHDVVGDDDLGRRFGEPPASLVDGLPGVAERRVGGFGLTGRGFLRHLSYPTVAISKRSGGDPHPATTSVRASGSYGSAGRCAQISSAGFASS